MLGSVKMGSLMSFSTKLGMFYVSIPCIGMILGFSFPSNSVLRP